MLFIWISLFFIILIFGSIKKRVEVTNIIDNRLNCILRGICALEILIGHTCTIANEKSLIIYEKAMICCVGLFFMLSGYGLLHSLLDRRDYMEDFLRKRLTSIFLPVIECYTSYIVILKIQNNQPFYKIVVENPFMGFINWYIIELVVMYIIFFFIFKNIKIKRAIGITCIISIISVIVMYNSGLHKCWYVSTLCFPLGIILKYNENIVIKFLENNYRIKLFSATIFFLASLSCFIFEEKGFILILVCRSWATLAFCIIVVVFIINIKIENKFLFFIGKNSYSIYLYHIMLLNPLEFVIDRNGIIMYIVMLIACSLVLGKSFEYINKNFKRVLIIYKER